MRANTLSSLRNDELGRSQMYICLCNGLTDRQVRDAARESGGTLAQIHRSLGVRVQCGKCLPAMREILCDPLCDRLNEKAPTLPVAGN